MNIINKFIPPILLDLYRILSTKRRTFKIGKYDIKVPYNFILPYYQKQFRLYDRFLPVLAKCLPNDKIIIDVGANIGDTVISLLSQCKNQIYCFEPSSFFYPYLEKNINILDSYDINRVKIFKKLIGTGKLNGDLKHTIGGTANLKLIDNSNFITHSTLDSIIEDCSNVVLLKVDIDGFDFDVIQSADKICKESEPILFWENEISEEFQYQGFNELYAWLENRDYKYIYIFDNFGNLILSDCDFKQLRSLNYYLYSMKKNGNTRTIHYFDILASTEKYRYTVEKAIDVYSKEWINFSE
ncbi:MAG TPA: FkbM family methyltransferase [Saprospiraceae bacterium]|nr:FkbM family methyltransferase [Saprospiraceae bacterium]